MQSINTANNLTFMTRIMLNYTAYYTQVLILFCPIFFISMREGSITENTTLYNATQINSTIN